MTRVIYINGQYRRYADAHVHAEDRGFQFADSVYEVIEVRDGHLVDATHHLERLARSLGELHMPSPMSNAALRHVISQTVQRNRVHNGSVYLQVTRGAGPREFLFPDPTAAAPTLVCFARPANPAAQAAKAAAGIAVITVSDVRWGRCDIKTTMLLPACLAKSEARSHGAAEAWFVDAAGCVTEGASSNAWIVTAANEIVTRPSDRGILAGITRRTTLDAIAQRSLTVCERAFTPAQAYTAREAFITSATGTVTPVVRIDGHSISDGTPGPISRLLRSIFHQAAALSRIPLER